MSLKYLRYLIYGVGSSIFINLFNVHTSFARLGMYESNVPKKQSAIKLMNRSMNNNTAYTVHEYESNSIKIKEYASTQSGIIFAVSWMGLSHPDLDDLLGSYVNQYNDAKQKAPKEPGQRSHSSVSTNNIVVRTWGHMRKLQGRAYDPSLVPNGVNPDELQ